MINVTRTDLPDIKTYINYINKIWKNNWLTNRGEFEQLLEKKLTAYLNVAHLNLVTNGTLAIQLAVKALELDGEVITTPFTFAATTTALIWEGLTPVFADIDPHTFNIDPVDVESKITPKTSAILAVHVYGNPCDVDALSKIAKKHRLKLVYDAAHAFGVKYRNKSVLSFGDMSTLSFHATKTFHTIEGGAIVTKNKSLHETVNLLKNFGIRSEEKVVLPGINAKMNEFQAIMGLCNLHELKEKTLKREHIYKLYSDSFNKHNNIRLQKLLSSTHNYSYMPVCFENKDIRDRVYNVLMNNNIKARKYFYPLTSQFQFNRKRANSTGLKNSRRISDGILCLPIYSSLPLKEVERIIKIVLSASSVS